MQDGYAVRAAEGAGEYEVEFEQLAGSAPGKLTQGRVAYITTGTTHVKVNGGFLMCIRAVSATCIPCPGIM